MSFVAGEPSHILRHVYSVPTLYKPKSVAVTRSLSDKELILSLLSERDRCVHMYLLDPSRVDESKLIKQIPEICSIQSVNFIRGQQNDVLASLEIQSALRNQETQSREQKYLTKCIRNLPQEIACLNEQGDTLHIFHGGANQIAKLSVLDLTKNNQVAC